MGTGPILLKIGKNEEHHKIPFIVLLNNEFYIYRVCLGITTIFFF